MAHLLMLDVSLGETRLSPASRIELVGQPGHGNGGNHTQFSFSHWKVVRPKSLVDSSSSNIEQARHLTKKMVDSP
jgi:hypothetical protein